MKLTADDWLLATEIEPGGYPEVLRVFAFGAFFLFSLGWYEYDRRTPPRRQRFDDALTDHARGALDESRRIAASARELIRPPVEPKPATDRTRPKKRAPSRPGR